MKRAILLAILLAGCQTEATPVPQTECEKGARLLGNPNLDPFQKQTILEKMRNLGCMK